MSEVTLVSAVLLRPGSDDLHRALHDEGVDAARRIGDLLRAQLVPAVPGVQEDTVALLTFGSGAGLDAWLASPERHEILRRMRRVTQGDRRTNVLSEFPAWFPSGSASPPRWKQAIIVIAGLIPVSLIVTYARTLVAPDLPMIAATALTSAANVCALTWVIMPRLNALLEAWLTQPSHTRRR
jgi:antibiotic biosynthesis monooxygenase (ABM) superfamily enzyme